MKTRILIFMFVMLAIFACSFTNQTKKQSIEVVRVPHGNGPAGTAGVLSTGAPGEVTCAACHGGGTHSADMFLDEIYLNAAALGYLKGQLHVFLTEIMSTNPYPYAGFQVTILDTAGNQAGFPLYPNTPNSNISTRYFSNITRRFYMEHDKPVTPNLVFKNGSANYRAYLGFAWQASPFYEGPVYVRACGIIANGDSAVTGDKPMCLELVLYHAQTLDGKIKEVNQEEKEKDIWYLGFSDNTAVITTDLSIRKDIEIELINLHGTIVQSKHLSIFGRTQNKVNFDVAAGFYILRVWDGTTIKTRKVTITN